MRVLVCGGRDFTDLNAVFRGLDEFEGVQGDITLLIHGAAKGADTLAAEWAKHNRVPTKAFPANWKAYGKAAGAIRNQQMLDAGKPDWVIAFPGGKGTADMTRRAGLVCPIFRPASPPPHPGGEGR